jgi:exosortase A
VTAQLAADSVAAESRPSRSSWWPVGAIYTIVIAVAVSYWPTIRSLAQLWGDFDGITYTHGSLIVLISAWLIARARSGLPVDADGCPRAAVALAGASLLWLLSYRAGIEIFAQLLLPLIAWLAVLALLGSGIARRCAFAFAFIYFAIPVWDFGNEILQSLTLRAVSIALTIAKVPAFVDGDLVHIPSGVFEIAGGCSGLHFLIVATALAALYGEVNDDSLKVRAQLLVLAAGLAVLCNWARVFWIIRVGYQTEMQHPLVSVSHYYFGWKVFAGMMVIFFLIARLMPMSEAGLAGIARTAGGGLRPSRYVPLVLAAVLLGPLWAWLTARAGMHDNRAFALPDEIGGSMAQRGAVSDWQPKFAGADFTEAVTYSKAGRSVEAFTAIYYEQRQGKELVGFGNAVNGALQVAGFGRISVPSGEFAEIEARNAAGEASLIWYYYDIEGWRTTRDLTGQLMYGLRSLAGAPLSRIIAYRMTCEDDCPAARVAMRTAAAELDLALPALR